MQEKRREKKRDSPRKSAPRSISVGVARCTGPPREEEGAAPREERPGAREEEGGGPREERPSLRRTVVMTTAAEEPQGPRRVAARLRGAR